jgi:hypothetical protein
VVLLLLLVLAAVALGIIGAVVKGLLYLLIIGCVVFVVALFLMGFRLRRRRPVR